MPKQEVLYTESIVIPTEVKITKTIEGIMTVVITEETIMNTGTDTVEIMTIITVIIGHRIKLGFGMSMVGPQMNFQKIPCFVKNV
jgi:hypothetical protein